MARVSRRKGCARQMESSPAGNQQTAAYIRLSRETDGSLERDTIGSQTALVQDFISSRDELTLYDTYVDDSVSGTKFSRPAFDRMLPDMRGGKIQTIVVKDMSRLGRDYIEAGNLVEHVFPLYGIRLISITDGFDTEKDPAGLMMAVTNLANAMYAQDISRKINSAKEEMVKKGIPTSKVPFGYRMDRSDRSDPVMYIDEEAAKVVRRIFDEFIGGKGTTGIARMFNDENVPTPMAYRYLKLGQADKAGRYKWTPNMVQQILYNETYTGKYAMAKTVHRLYQKEERIFLPKEEWTVFENHHPAIISRERFAEAQGHKQKKGARGKNAPNLLREKVFCGCCGAHMGIPDSAAKTPKYVCRTNWYYGKGCVMGSVRKSIVYDAVFDTIKDTVRLFLNDEAVIGSCRKRKEEDSGIGTDYRRKLDKLRGSMREIEAKKTALYEDFCSGLLEEAEYLFLNGRYTEEMKQLSVVAEELQKQGEKEKKAKETIASISKKISRFKGKRKLSQEMVDAMIERVDVYDEERIEVTLKFEDELRFLSEGTDATNHCQKMNEAGKDTVSELRKGAGDDADNDAA